MAFVTPLYGGSQQQLDYRLGQQYGCTGHGINDVPVDYRLDVRERPLRWIGDGLAEFGITAGSELTSAQFGMARALIAGQDPNTGEQLVSGKLAVPDDAKLALAPLVAAVRAHAQAHGVAARALFPTARQAQQWDTAERQVQRYGEAARLRADEALAFADAALPPADGEDALTRLPWQREEITQAYANLFEVHLARDATTGGVRVERSPRRVDVGIKGFDLNIGLPKSYSLLLAFADEDVADRVEEIYTRAAERVFGWTEGRTSYVMRGQHGRGRTAECQASSGFSGWVMVHRAARPVDGAAVGDPHWHVHITITNMARGADGQWSTVAAGGRDLMRHAAALDKLTQAEVRRTLSAELGVEFARNARTGLWEVAAIPDATIRLFSQRGAQVEAVLGELGYSRQEASQAQQRVLTRQSRNSKTETTAAPDATLRGTWRERAVAAGGEHDPQAFMPQVLANHTAAIEHSGQPAAATQPVTTVAAIAQSLADPESGLTAQTRRFSRLDALCRVADELPTGADIATVESMTDLVLEHPAIVSLSGSETAVRGGAGQRTQLGARHMSDAALYTTRDVPEVESQILEVAAASSAGQCYAVVGADILQLATVWVEAEQGFTLSAEQRQVLAEVVGQGHQLRTVEGPPGTGKTTLMRTARLAWKTQGYTVAGAATAAVAAQNLQAESGIETTTVAGWVDRIEHGPGLAGIHVLVLDEANLTNDRDRARLYAEAVRTGTKVVEVGDPHQLRGVGVGSLFGYTHRLLDGPRLTENRRQREEDERRTLATYRAGGQHEALQDWASRGRVHATETASTALSGMVATWMGQRLGAPDVHTQLAGLVMLAASNEKVARINEATQAVRRSEGELGAGRTFRTAAGGRLTVHEADQVLIRRNDRGLRVTGETVLNGYRGVVTGITDAGVAVAWRDADGGTHSARLSPSYVADGGLELGYALTVHKAEGLTVGASWTRPDGTEHRGSVLTAASGMDHPTLYVSASRHAGELTLFGSREELEGDREQLEHGTPRSQDELTARVAGALAERAEATVEASDDRPVLADLGEVPAEPEQERSQQRAEQADAALDDRGAHARFRTQQPEASPENRARLQRSAPAAPDVSRQVVEASKPVERLLTPPGQSSTGGGRSSSERAKAAEVDRRLQELGHKIYGTGEYAWRQREHGQLTEAELEQRLTEQRRQHEKALQRQHQHHEQIAERAPAVEAGNGPRAVAVDEHLAEQQRRGELAGQLDELTRQRDQQRGDAAEATAWASQAQQRAEEAPWYRPGLARSEANHAEALHLRAGQAADEVERLDARISELTEEFGGHADWASVAAGARRSETTYERDRAQAQQADERDLEQLHGYEHHDATRAERAAAEITSLEHEQHLRAEMPGEQASLEDQARHTWINQQQVLAQEREQRQAERAHERSLEADLDLDPPGLHLDRGLDGPSLGL